METALEFLIEHRYELNGDDTESIIKAMKSFAVEYGKNLPIYTICSHCNMEFQLIMGNTPNERTSTFQTCTNCGKRNDKWISIKLNQPL